MLAYVQGSHMPQLHGLVSNQQSGIVSEVLQGHREA